MNRRILASVLAALVVGGTATAVVPQHGASIVRVLATTVVAVAGGLLLAAIAPTVSREPTRTGLDTLPDGSAPPLDPHGLRDARRDIGRPSAVGSVPAPVRDRLLVAARMAVHDRLGPDGPPDDDALRARLSPATRRLLTQARLPATTRDPEATAAAVHRALDEITALIRPTGAAHGHR